MVTKISPNGVSLSAHAGQNGFRLPAIATRSPGAGDFANREEGRQRRQDRRNKAMQRSFFAGL